MLQMEPKIDFLILNAGVGGLTTLQYTTHGFERNVSLQREVLKVERQLSVYVYPKLCRSAATTMGTSISSRFCVRGFWGKLHPVGSLFWHRSPMAWGVLTSRICIISTAGTIRRGAHMRSRKPPTFFLPRYVEWFKWANR